ncbi:iron complex transport system ATP-binding protein [Leucobacter luti]|uniref:Iron complex transport system ATP-binding protein n=1 Tax=Leucobacter luti TaxID=340320 RepID=A0A4Q7TX95_9MICO|nr:ABC transporter ATP-binding protein [Leucobacter luti]RZT64867.1 iron complex transport system ATP-binding protein [Leucobacter luti]
MRRDARLRGTRGPVPQGNHGQPVPARLRGFAAVRGGTPLSEPITLDLAPGSVLGLLGPNGAGKSSLLSALARTGVAHRGSFAHGGVDLGGLGHRPRARRIALLPQDLAAPPELLVSELVGVGALAGTAPDPARAITGALERCGIAELAGRRFGTLSGGQKQLAQLARVLAQDTAIVLLDEPTAALDLGHQRAVERIINALAADGRIVVAALHDLTLALNVTTSALLLDRRGGAHTGPPGTVLRPDLVHDVYGVHTELHTTPGGRRILVPADTP